MATDEARIDLQVIVGSTANGGLAPQDVHHLMTVLRAHQQACAVFADRFMRPRRGRADAALDVVDQRRTVRRFGLQTRHERIALLQPALGVGDLRLHL